MDQPFCRVKMAWIWPPTSKEELSGWRVMTIQSQQDQVSKGRGASFPPIPMSSGVFPEEVTGGPVLHACG